MIDFPMTALCEVLRLFDSICQNAYLGEWWMCVPLTAHYQYPLTPIEFLITTQLQGDFQMLPTWHANAPHWQLVLYESKPSGRLQSCPIGSFGGGVDPLHPKPFSSKPKHSFRNSFTVPELGERGDFKTTNKREKKRSEVKKKRNKNPSAVQKGKIMKTDIVWIQAWNAENFSSSLISDHL